MNKENKNKKRVSLYLNEDKWKKLKVKAAKEETNASKLVRKAIEEKYFK